MFDVFDLHHEHFSCSEKMFHCKSKETCECESLVYDKFSGFYHKFQCDVDKQMSYTDILRINTNST